MKSKVNLTIDDRLLLSSKKKARKLNISLSKVVEDLLKDFVDPKSSNIGGWIDSFHQKYKVTQGKISDEDVQNAREDMLKKHS